MKSSKRQKSTFAKKRRWYQGEGQDKDKALYLIRRVQTCQDIRSISYLGPMRPGFVPWVGGRVKAGRYAKSEAVKIVTTFKNCGIHLTLVPFREDEDDAT